MSSHLKIMNRVNRDLKRETLGIKERFLKLGKSKTGCLLAQNHKSSIYQAHLPTLLSSSLKYKLHCHNDEWWMESIDERIQMVHPTAIYSLLPLRSLLRRSLDVGAHCWRHMTRSCQPTSEMVERLWLDPKDDPDSNPKWWNTFLVSSTVKNKAPFAGNPRKTQGKHPLYTLRIPPSRMAVLAVSMKLDFVVLACWRDLILSNGKMVNLITKWQIDK